MEAERETVDRYVAAWLAERVGEIVNAASPGCRASASSPPSTGSAATACCSRATSGEYFRFDEAARQLIGDESGETYRIGQRLELRLAEANPVSGSLRFELPEGSYGGEFAPRRDRVRRPAAQGERGRPANIRHRSRK